MSKQILPGTEVDGDPVVRIQDRAPGGPSTELPHTVTKPEFRGQGLAGKVVDFALADIAAAGKKVRPTCPYVARRIAEKPEFAHLLER